jgi:hypothetical protein
MQDQDPHLNQCGPTTLATGTDLNKCAYNCLLKHRSTLVAYSYICFATSSCTFYCFMCQVVYLDPPSPPEGGHHSQQTSDPLESDDTSSTGGGTIILNIEKLILRRPRSSSFLLSPVLRIRIRIRVRRDPLCFWAS